MKKLCFVTTISMTIKAFVLPTIKRLSDMGCYDITVICDTDDSLRNFLPEGVKYIPVKMARGVSFSAFSSIRRLKQIFLKEKFDYIQFSTPNAAFYSSIAAKKSSCPVRLYGQWGIRYVSMHGIKKMLFKHLEKLTCRNSTHIRAVSSLNLDFAVSEGLYVEEKAKVIGNGGTVGVDLSIFDKSHKQLWREQVRKNYKIKEDAFVFGFVGRLARDKGITELLSSFRALSEKQSNVYLFVVGPNELNAKTELLEWAKQSDRVVFTGGFEKTELPRFYAAFDSYVHPTYREGFGMVLQEAGAMGNAIITTKVPGACEVMEEGKSCLLVPPKNTNMLYEAMKRISNDKELACSLGDEAWKRTKELYETNKMVDFVVEDIRNVLREAES